MAKIATAGPLPPTNTIHFGGAGSTVTTTTLKRKTPAELRREELLKRRNASVMELADKSQLPFAPSSKDGDGVILGNKKDMPKSPKYRDTRVDGLYRARKRCNRLRLLSKDEVVEENPPVAVSSRLKNSSVATHLAAEIQPQDLCNEDSATSIPSSEDRATSTKAHKVAGKANDGTFRGVKELAFGGENVPGLSNLDMDKALKGLVAHGAPASESQLESYERTSNFRTQISPLDFSVSGKKSPLDLTLKTTMRIISSASVNWFHRSVNCATFHNQFQCGSYATASEDQDFSGHTSSVSRWSSGAFSSWMFPQSPLSPLVISALTSAAVEGQVDFWNNRQQAWEDSFRSLYYMLRTRICDLFYVCTSQFVVMFTACDGPKNAKRTCNAYISRSTRGLRSLLKEHDVCFSMPLFPSKGDDITAEDLTELPELDKPSLQEADHFVAMSYVDNGSQSLLMFSGNQNVHGLYDFLLNYRYYLTSLTGVDVPILCSPVPFENGALSSPQVRCKEVRRADQLHLSSKDLNGEVELARGSSPGICYSVEIKDTYLPPWVVTSVCSAMASDGKSFEARYAHLPTTLILFEIIA
ncbi:OLC1v1033987C1 [Oldenlandia corymbosa var. corymbosa]|uniref:OLC1v1033987C1 n=1 Tax=Oldenlandia corymbosa var. corymbosa TaxID=529605 RepID=A0AAV1CQ99_OLDCO|nr:OLC1v1033987C1 [Oldenlandia corymbosa var. corymbosa]